MFQTAEGGDPQYAWQKIYIALDKLVLHPGEIRERLIAACNSGLFAVTDRDMPTPETRKQWLSIRQRIAGMGTRAVSSW